jgi:OmpA family
MLKPFHALIGTALLLGACTDTTQALAPPPSSPPPAQVRSYMVFYDWDRSDLSGQAMSTIQQAAGTFRNGGQSRITAVGYTDTSGPRDYNMALSLRRSNTVKNALVQQGVPSDAVVATGRGEDGLLVPTADGVREPQNRRVEMVVLAPVMSDAQYCAILASRVREVSRGNDPSGNLGRALSNCQTGTGDYGIPFMVQFLSDNKVPVPPRS